MIELFIQTTLIFGVTTVAALLWRGSASQRHAIWMLAFGAVPIVIALSFLLRTSGAVVDTGFTFSVMSGAPTQDMAQHSISVWMVATTLLLLRLAFSFAWVHYRRDEIAAPIVFGVIKPQILLPPCAADWSAALRRSVLLHEQAHIDRRDTLAHIYSQLVCAFIWFQPFAWYAAYRSAQEREHACDDAALRSGISPSQYASHLVEVARTTHEVPLWGVAMARSFPLERRIFAIVDQSTNRTPITPQYRLALLLIAAILTVPVAALAVPQGVVHQSGEVGVVGPKLITKVEPQYTAEAQDAGITGSVVVAVEISREGKVQNAKVVRSLDPGLDKNALAALNDWKFEPATKDGKPVVFAAKIEIRYGLQ